MDKYIYSIDFGGYKTTLSRIEENRCIIVENVFSEKSSKYK